ncbi:hypothetical protein HK097_006987 [Rhizophlyctis rosea]|uniref:ADF-H domain-containing protein n=1 Tax=Rhizophlyctis rosea TaxID=64517 RepID=A0AAD5X682_9FUNG|nr:hypothetical protein HK097_006987 [Rhizophlyctis rosea]
MSAQNTTDVPEEVVEELKVRNHSRAIFKPDANKQLHISLIQKFRFRKSKSNAAIILKIDVKDLKVVVEEILEDTTIEDVAEALPDSTPRYIVLSYELKHKDGRVSYPLVGIYYNPTGSSTANRMLYASTNSYLFQKADIAGKIFDLNDSEDLTDEWLTEKLEGSKTRP